MTLENGFMGGSLIGISAAILLLFSGEIMGSSGIVNSVMINPLKALEDPSQHWKLVFLASFLLTASTYLASYDEMKLVADSRSTIAFVLSGLLVGFGTKVGNGCTSGHGICGLGRLSLRSLTAVLTFMICAILSTLLTKDNAIFLDSSHDVTEDMISFSKNGIKVLNGLLVAAALLAPYVFHKTVDADGQAKVLPGLVTGAIFALGLSVSGMSNPANVLGFLDVSAIPRGTWDPTLMAVMGSGVLVSFASYQLIVEHSVFPSVRRYSISKPLAMRRESRASFALPTNTQVDSSLLLGAACFGVGWSLTGMCPAPAIFMAAAGIPQVLLQWWPAYFTGMYVGTAYKNRI